MLSTEENKTLTNVGAGTPAGEWLRRFWHPIAISDKWTVVKTHWNYESPITIDGEVGTV